MGFPLDLIDRSVIIATHGYDSESIREILRIRGREEKVTIDNDALEKLTEVGAFVFSQMRCSAAELGCSKR